MKLFQHLDDEGKVLYEEVCHRLTSVEAWINQHFGRALPAGHTATMTAVTASEVGGAPTAGMTNSEGGDQNGKPEGNQDSQSKDLQTGSPAPSLGSATGQEDTSEQDQGSGEAAGTAGEGSEVRGEHQEEVKTDEHQG